MNIRTIRSYDKEFKLNAVKLYLASSKKYHEISKELGIPTGTLVTWVKSHNKDGEESFCPASIILPVGDNYGYRLVSTIASPKI